MSMDNGAEEDKGRDGSTPVEPVFQLTQQAAIMLGIATNCSF